MSLRCSLCLSTHHKMFKRTLGEYDSDLYIVGDKKLPFCSGIHHKKYLELHGGRYRMEVKCHAPYCTRIVTDVYVPVYCDCGAKHQYCEERCRNDRNEYVRKYLSNERKIPSLITCCQTCLCSEADESSDCVYRHLNRCVSCHLNNKCRKCLAQTWYQGLLSYFNIWNTTWEEYERSIIVKNEFKCPCGKKTNELYFVHGCNHIFCKECVTLCPGLNCSQKHKYISNLYVQHVGRI